MNIVTTVSADDGVTRVDFRDCPVTIPRRLVITRRSLTTVIQTIDARLMKAPHHDVVIPRLF